MRRFVADGAGIGSLLTLGRERRNSRADLLKAIAGLERARWAPVKDLRDALRDVLVAALLARAPRRVVIEYVALAQVAACNSHENWAATNGEDEYAGGIDGELADVVSDAAALFTTVTWQPTWGRIVATWRLRRIHAKAASLKPGQRATIGRARRGVM